MSRTLRRDAVFSHFVSHWVRSCRSLVTATELHIERGYLTLVQTFLSDQIHENTPLPGYYTQNYNKLHKIIQIAVKVKRCWLYLDLSYKREKKCLCVWVEFTCSSFGSRYTSEMQKENTASHLRCCGIIHVYWCWLPLSPPIKALTNES